MHRPHLPPESAGICAPQVPMSTEWLHPEGSEFHKSLKEARETRRLGQDMRGRASRRGQGQWHRGNSNAFLRRQHWKEGGSYSNRRPWTTELDRWREQSRPRAVRLALPAVRHHRASIFFWQWSHWFHLRCVLLTTHQCPVSCKQTLITVFAYHWCACWCFISIILFDNLELFKKRRERES